MRNILIDTNIVLDLALERSGFVENAIELIRFTAKNKVNTSITVSTVTDIYYVLRKQKGHDNAIGFLKQFFMFIDILTVDKNTIFSAIYSDRKDFEDSVQIETAKQNDINIVITRNKKDFENSGLEIYTPNEYLDKLKNKQSEI